MYLFNSTKTYSRVTTKHIYELPIQLCIQNTTCCYQSCKHRFSVDYWPAYDPSMSCYVTAIHWLWLVNDCGFSQIWYMCQFGSVKRCFGLEFSSLSMWLNSLRIEVFSATLYKVRINRGLKLRMWQIFIQLQFLHLIA